MADDFTLAQSTQSPSWGDASLDKKKQREKVKYPITMRDGQVVELELWPEVMSNAYSADERAALIRESFKRQYKMSGAEMAAGLLAHVAQGGSLGTSDEMVGFLGGFLSGPEGVEKGIASQRAVLDKFALKYPYLTTGAQTVGAIIPVVLDTIFGTKGAASLPLAAKTISQATTSALHPLRMASSTIPRGTVEGAAKAGVWSGAHEFGASEGSPRERMEHVPEAFNVGAAVGGPLTFSLMGASKLPDAWRATREFGTPTLTRRADQAINRNIKDFSGRLYQSLVPEGERATLSPKKQSEFADSLFSDASPPSVAFRALTDADSGGGPWGNLVGEHRRPLLAEGLGLNTLDPSSGMPVRDAHLPSLLQWGSRADRLAGGQLHGNLEARAMNEPDMLQAALRRQHGPFPFDQTKALNVAREDARDVWSAYYRDAYFNPDTGAINTVPMAGTKDVPGSGFIRMFQDDPVLYKSIYKQAAANRSTAIAHPSGDMHWPRHIDGINQQLPSWEMFIAGERWIPTSTWGTNSKALTSKGWERVKNTDGTFLIDDGSYVIANKNKQVEVKTLHDMRIAMDDLINSSTDAGRGAALTNARGVFNDKFQKVAPDAMAQGDLAFANQKGVESAGKAGLAAMKGENATPETIRNTMEGLESSIEKRMFLSGFAQKMKAEGMTAEEILSNPTTRTKMRAIFDKGGAGEEAFGRFLAEVSSIRRMDHTRADIGDPARGFIENAGQQFSSLMWTMFAKIPAYKFSAMFAGARDLTTIARNVEKGQNQIVGQEMARRLSAETPEQLVVALRKLDAEYRRTLPKDAAELRQIAALLRTAMSGSLQESPVTNPMRRVVRGFGGLIP